MRSQPVDGKRAGGPGDEVLELEEVGGRAITEDGIRAVLPTDSQDGEVRQSVPTSVGRPGSKLEASLTLSLTRKELDELTRVARQHRLSTEELVRELVRGHLKWLG